MQTHQEKNNDRVLVAEDIYAVQSGEAWNITSESGRVLYQMPGHYKIKQLREIVPIASELHFQGYQAGFQAGVESKH